MPNFQPTDARSKLEARKALRTERAIMWKRLMDEKPDDSYEDPRDVAAIRYAETHMGDYKLKTGPKYIVPENERVDADKKKRQILLLKESVYSLKEVQSDKFYVPPPDSPNSFYHSNLMPRFYGCEIKRRL
jgi:hypothetical protein